MDQDQIVIKPEMESNGELLVFYVNENGTTEQGVVTSIESIKSSTLDEFQQGSYIIEDIGEATTDESMQYKCQSSTSVTWEDEETNKLLIFYMDNKETFLNGNTKRSHLWTVACKTMLTEKSPALCEIKLQSLKHHYSSIRLDQGKNVFVWPYYDLCHKAFHDDNYVNTLISNNTVPDDSYVVATEKSYDDGILVTTKKGNNRSTPDKQVEQMLNLYLKLKKKSSGDFWQKQLWETIALGIGEDGDYWHKRFLNYKQRYIRMLEKRKESGSKPVNWPYMNIFDEIYKDDQAFQSKYGNVNEQNKSVNVLLSNNNAMEWDDTEKTVLVKYCFDCFDEFQDSTIPNNFLWNEIGRLLDKSADMCKKKYEELKTAHLDQYISEVYDLRNRIPIAILFDNIIAKETELQFAKSPKQTKHLEQWDTEEVDELVQFFYNNSELLKDPICHFVCWAAISKKIQQNIYSCRFQWLDLTSLYKVVLEDKKENPDMEIQWRYIDLFDRIFDFGMDTKLLDGYEASPGAKDKGKIGVKKLNIKLAEDITEVGTDDEEYDERGFVKRSRGTGESNQFQILEFYQKNKDKFSTSQRKKMTLWGVLAKQIGISAEECGHRFRNLKQVYTAYIQREINKPEMPILWPYYALCKKVFGYRAIKNKLKNSKIRPVGEEWSAKEIKQLINYFAKNFDHINNNPEDKHLWLPLTSEIGKTESSCSEKFIELRKSYRKIKTMRGKNPNCKVNWKYFNMFDAIYSGVKNEIVDLDSSDDLLVPMETQSQGSASNDIQDEDYQCIIVMPDGEQLTTTSQIINSVSEVTEKPITKRNLTFWNRISKIKLLRTYLKYVSSRKGKIINIKEMWTDIVKQFPDKSYFGCKRMFYRMRSIHKEKTTENDENYKSTKFCTLFKKILSVKVKFIRPPFTIEDVELKEMTTYKDVTLPHWKVEQALKYYLEHIEEFLSPKYVKKYVWLELARNIAEPITKVFKKINYLKQFYNSETNEVGNENVEFADLLKEIFDKEIILKIALTHESTPMTVDDEPETIWTEDEIEQLLIWYLDNLHKFKNPKFVPSYLWMEASNVLQKSALSCSKKMSEIRTQYSSMVKELPEALDAWRFHELCQKIYGTGKKTTLAASEGTS